MLGAMNLRSPRSARTQRQLWLLALCAWLSLVCVPILTAGQPMACCPMLPASMGAMPGMAMPAMAMDAAHAPAARPGLSPRQGDQFADPAAGGGHVSCLLCAGAAWLGSVVPALAVQASAPAQLYTMFAVRPAPEGDWRRRLRPPSLV